ncbi:MAG: BON domain-containing protein [Stellaceae bacterium]
MSRLHPLSLLALSLALPFGLGGCAVAIVGGLAAAGGAGYAANQERGVNGTADDFTIKNKIESAWGASSAGYPPDFTATVYQGRALLTGIAPTPQLKAEAAQSASQVPGVRAVYNEIEVAPYEGAWSSAQDAWITTQVRSDLVFSNIRSVNYHVDTVDHSVYLIGSARSQAELDHATDLARNVPGVRRVVSYVEIRPGEPPGPPVAGMPPADGAPPGPPPFAGGPPPGSDASGAAPTTPVAVQKL